MTMSGPKSSRYTLTAEQRRALMISIQKRLAQQERVRLSAVLAQIEADSLRAQAIAGDAKKEMAADYERLIRQYEPLLSGELPDDLEALDAGQKKLQAARREAGRAAEDLNRSRAAAEASRKERMARDLTAGYGATLDSALDARRDEARREHLRRVALLEQAAAEAVREETAGEAKKLLAQYRQAPPGAFRDALFVTSVQPLLKRHRAERDQYAREEAEYQALLARYEDLCQELSEPQEPQPWTPGALASLKALTDQMEQRLMRQEEEAYICRTLDDVMRAMGYPLLGTREVAKRSGRRFHHALYTFEDGTAIDVTYSDDGQIAMELGGLDDRDRVPDDRETIRLCDAMQEFCTSFAQIEEALRRRGVVLRERIRMLPPSEENAQIINTRDYRLSSEPTLFDVDRRAEGGDAPRRMARDEDGD